MKIVFLSNFYNHHQSYVSRKLYEFTNGQYRFIETTNVPEERIKFGYSDHKDEFVLHYEKNREEAQRWIDSADVVIAGSTNEKLLSNRKKNNKIIFKYAERPLKNGFEIWKYPIRWFRWHISNPNSKPIYMLCSSAYTASDYAKFGMYKNKTYKWGYFPEYKHYDDIENLILNKNTNEILWCGRFLDWKHPDDVLEIAYKLKKDNYKFHISIIGTGEMEDFLCRSIVKNNLQEYVSILGPMSPEQVRQHMEGAGIYLFTSDRKEGWGAVLNESMNSACAVVASSEIGAVPYLINDNVNGLVYKTGDIDELYEKVKSLLDSKEKQRRFGKAAYQTISSEWNYEVASERLVYLIEYTLAKKDGNSLFDSGPCSKA